MMKKLFTLGIILLFVSLTSCDGYNGEINQVSNLSENSSGYDVSNNPNEYEPPISPEDILTVPTVRVTIEEWDGSSDQALELIYEDDSYSYYLSSIRSNLIMLTTEDGLRISLREALEGQKIGMFDLIQSGLDVIKMQKNDTDTVIDFTVFLELLTANGFEFETPELTQTNSILSVISKLVYIGDEIITVYEYDSVTEMERDASRISPSGTSIGDDQYHPSIEISWDSEPLWVKGNVLIVLYTGENSSISNFLLEHFEHFSWYAYQQPT